MAAMSHTAPPQISAHAKTANGSHSGDMTQIQSQSITRPSFSPMKSRSSAPPKLMPPDVLLLEALT